MRTTAAIDPAIGDGRMKRQVKRRASITDEPLSIPALRSSLRGLPRPRSVIGAVGSVGSIMRSMQRPNKRA